MLFTGCCDILLSIMQEKETEKMSMNKVIRKSRMIQYIIAVTAAVMFIVVGPLGLIKHHVTLKSTELVAEMTEPVSVDKPVLQMFVAQECEELERIHVYVCSEYADTVLQLRVKDTAMNDLRVATADISDMQEPGFASFEINLPIEGGQEYYYTVESLGEEVLLGLEETADSGVTTNGTYMYNGEDALGLNLITRYEYVAALSEKREAVYCIGIVLFAAALLFAVKQLFEKKWKDSDVLAGTWVRNICNPLVAVGTIVSAAVIFPGKMFSSRPLDLIVYESGVVLLAAALFFGLNHKRDEKYDRIKKRMPKYRIADLLQAFCIAKCLWYCMEYVNGLSNYAHYENFRYVLIWLSLALICTFTRKEVWSKVNAVYLVLVIIAGIIYKVCFPGVLEEESLMTLTVLIAAFGGIVIIRVIRNLFGREIRRGNMLQAVLLMALAAVMIIFRHKWAWPIVMTVMCAVFYLRFGAWKRRRVFSDNLANGILLSFAAVVIQSLLHRPYHYFMYIRYPMTFHTSTTTAIYLTVVLCAALAKYFAKTRYSLRLQDTWKELFVTAAAAAYLVMTLSRTGYVAIIAAGAVLLIFVTPGRGKRKLKRMGIQFVSLLLAAVISMPVIFTVTRTVPAVVNDPYIYDIEVFIDSIVKGDEPDSRRYMTVSRFVTAFNMRILGMEEKEAMIFGSDDPGYVAMMKENYIFVASAAEGAGTGEEAGDTMFDVKDISNGRFDIYKSYWDHLNWTGHEAMSVDGKVMHAHNIYLQTAHDNGIAAGVLLVILNVVSVGAAFVYYKKRRRKVYMACMPLALTTAFLVVGIVEWTFHPCNPFGFVWLLIMAPLLFDMKEESVE